MLQNPTLALPSKQASSSSATFSSRDNRSHDAIHLDSAESESILFINNGTFCSGLCGEDDEGPFSGMPALNRTLSDDPSQEFWRVLSASLHTMSPGVSQHIADDVGVSVKSLLGMHSSLYGPAGTGTLSPIRLSQNDVLLSLHRILRACRAGLLRVGGDGDGDVDLDNLIDALERAGKQQQAATVRDKSLLFPSASLPPLPPRSAHAHAHVPVPVPVPELELEHESGLHEQGGEMASPLAFGLLHSSRTHTHNMCVDAGRPQLFSSASASASASASSTNANLKQPFSFASIVSPLSSLPSKARSIRSGPGAEAEAEAGVDPVLSLCLDHNEGEGEGEGEGMDTSSGSGGDCLSFTDVSNDAFAFAIQQQQQYQHQHQHQHQHQQQQRQGSRTPLSLPPTKKHCTYSDRE